MSTRSGKQYTLNGISNKKCNKNVKRAAKENTPKESATPNKKTDACADVDQLSYTFEFADDRPMDFEQFTHHSKHLLRTIEMINIMKTKRDDPMPFDHFKAMAMNELLELWLWKTPLLTALSTPARTKLIKTIYDKIVEFETIFKRTPSHSFKKLLPELPQYKKKAVELVAKYKVSVKKGSYPWRGNSLSNPHF